MRSKSTALLGLLLVTCTALVPVNGQSQPNPWVAITLLDLQGVHDILRDNHPGPVDPENSRYAKWLEDGLKQASDRARSVKSYSDYTRVLRFYTNGFQDGHLGAGFDITPLEVRWPGFIVGPDDGGAARVVYTEPDSGVTVGDNVLACDGRSIDELMKERVDPYFWNSAIPHQRRLLFHHLFHIDPNDVAFRFKSCRFSSGEVDLKWKRSERSEFEKMLGGALGRSDRELSLKQINGVWFVRVPTLAFSGEANVKKIRALLASLQEKTPELRKSTVVFDVRGNHGGASAWGEELASVLWGPDWVKYIEDGFDETVDWRVSFANIKWMESMVERQTKAGLTRSADYLKKVVDAMKKADAAGKPLARTEDEHKQRKQPAANPVSGKVYLLTDGECASACLDFADLMRRLPHVIHVGLPTSADAIYIDNTNADLPSGLGVLGYSLKVYRHRVRGNNEWYDPQVRWPGGPMTDEAVAKWIGTLSRD